MKVASHLKNLQLKKVVHHPKNLLQNFLNHFLRFLGKKKDLPVQMIKIRRKILKNLQLTFKKYLLHLLFKVLTNLNQKKKKKIFIAKLHYIG